MVLITKSERQDLDRVGLLKYKRTGHNPQDPNFVVVNKEHVGRDKTVYVAEEYDIMLFLQKYDGLNLQKIRKDQLQELIDNNLITADKVQHPHEYKHDAIAYVDDFGQCRIKKITNLMVFLGIWKSNRK